MAQVESKNRATSDPKARKAVLAEVEARGIEDMLLWFTDLEGHLKSFSITRSELEGALDDGMGFDGSSITGFNAIEESDMVAIPDPETFRVLPNGLEGADDLRHRHAGRPGVRRRSALRAPPRARADGGDGLRHLQRRPGGGVLPVQGRARHRDARRGRLLRADDDGRGDRNPPRHDQGARVDGDPGRVPPPRGRPVPARDRHPLRERARHGGLHAHVPPRRQGGREAARLPRDLHAEAAVRRERLRDAHAPVAVHGRAQRVLRRGRQVAPLRRRQGVHRRPAPPRARDLGGVRAVGQLVQAARARASRRRSTSRGRSGTAPR